MLKKYFILLSLTVSITYVLPCFGKSHDSNCTSSVYKKKPKALPPVQVTNISRLTEDLNCLQLNDMAELTGYTYFRNVSFDPRIAVNPTNPKNMVIATQQDTMTDADYNGSAVLSILVLYTLDGGKTWNPSNLVMSRCQGSTLFEANDNFISAYFPGVAFDNQGNCYVLSSSYYLFAANEQPDIETDEGNIFAKSTDGGRSWTSVSAALRNEGTCNYLDFPHIHCDPYRENFVYIASSDNTCIVQDLCQAPNYDASINIIFQKSADGGLSWSPVTTVDSFAPTDLSTCTPYLVLPHIEVLADKTKSLLIAALANQSQPDDVGPSPADQLYVWKSFDGGTTWTRYTVDAAIPHVLAVDPDSEDPILPITSFNQLELTMNPCNGYLYLVYTSPQFNPSGMSGCVIRKSKDGGITWSNPRPVNPNSLDAQAFLPVVAVAKDGTVGVMYHDMRKHIPGDEKLNTDVWLTLFDKELDHVEYEVRLTPQSFNTRKAIRGYNGINDADCVFDYYLSTHVEIEANGNDFVCVFATTNDACPPANMNTEFCDAFPLQTDECNRQNSVFVYVNRH